MQPKDEWRLQLFAQGNLIHMLPKDDWRLQLLAQGNLIHMLPKDEWRLQLFAQSNLIHMLPNGPYVAEWAFTVPIQTGGCRRDGRGIPPLAFRSNMGH